MGERLSIGRILWRDRVCFELSFVATFLWLLEVFLLLVTGSSPRSESDRLFLTVFTVGNLFLTSLSAALILWRSRIIRRVFATGETVRGKVGNLTVDTEGQRHVAIDYRYAGREYRATFFNEGVKYGKLAEEGEAIDLVVDPNKPSRAFIVKQYLERR